MVPMRDSQRQKVYNAESSFDYREEIKRVTLEEAQQIIENLAGDFSTNKPEAVVNNRLRRVAGQYTHWQNLIEFSNNTPKLSVVVHEFAHHLSRERSKGIYGLRAHGGSFTEAMIDCVDAAMGYKPKLTLNAAYIERNVLVGLRHEIEHVAENAKKEFKDPWRRDGEEGKVLVVKGASPYTGQTQYHAGVDSYGDRYAVNQFAAKGFRYRGAAEKAGKRLFGNDPFEIIEVDGHYDAHRKAWRPN